MASGITKYLPYVECLWNKKKLFEVTFFVTNRCNFKCPFCFNHESGKGELNLDQIGNICDKLGPFCRLLISGGEPFVRKDLSEICKLFIERNGVVHISIPTNGFYTKDIVEQVSKIATISKDVNINVSLSLDSLYEERDALVGVPQSFKNLVRTYWGLRDLSCKNVFIGTITTQCVENQYKLMEIYKYATQSLGVDNFGFNFARGTNASKELYKFFTDFLVKKYRSKVGVPFINSKCKLVYDAVYKQTPMKCYAGSLRKVVGADGQEYPCETIMFGGGCPCTHECDVAMNTLFNPKNLWKTLNSR